MEINELVKMIREKNQYTYGEFSKKTGVSSGFLSNVEKGTNSLLLYIYLLFNINLVILILVLLFISSIFSLIGVSIFSLIGSQSFC